MTDNLLALLIEVTSIPAAGRQLRKPIEVPRPEKKKPPPQQDTPAASAQDAAYKRGIAVLASSARAVR